MKRIIALVLALVASSAFGSVLIPMRNQSGSGYNIRGNDGTVAPCSGCVGEYQTATVSNFSQATPTLNSYYDLTGASLTLTPGNWLVIWSGNMDCSSVTISAVTQPGYMFLSLRSGTSTLVMDTASVITQVSGSGLRFGGGIYAMTKASPTTSTTYKLSAGFGAWSGTGQSCGTLQVTTPLFTAYRLN